MANKNDKGSGASSTRGSVGGVGGSASPVADFSYFRGMIREESKAARAKREPATAEARMEPETAAAELLVPFPLLPCFFV